MLNFPTSIISIAFFFHETKILDKLFVLAAEGIKNEIHQLCKKLITNLKQKTFSFCNQSAKLCRPNT